MPNAAALQLPRRRGGAFERPLAEDLLGAPAHGLEIDPDRSERVGVERRFGHGTLADDATALCANVLEAAVRGHGAPVPSRRHDRSGPATRVLRRSDRGGTRSPRPAPLRTARRRRARARSVSACRPRRRRPPRFMPSSSSRRPRPYFLCTACLLTLSASAIAATTSPACVHARPGLLEGLQQLPQRRDRGKPDGGLDARGLARELCRLVRHGVNLH